MIELQQFKQFIQEQWQKANFSSLTPIQEVSFPIIASGQDLLAESPTGTGKTLAYLLPILNKLDANNPAIQAVILAPTHELVMQIFNVAKQWAQTSDLRISSFIGGVSLQRQLDKLKKRPHLIIGTNGRVNELIKLKKIKMHTVTTIVLDEADQLLLQEHTETTQSIIKSALRDRQLILISATLPEKLLSEARDWMNNPQIIRVSQDKTPETIEHLYLIADQRDKITILEKLSKSDVSGLVFCKDIGSMTILFEKLAYKQVSLATIHSDTKKTEREITLKNFRAKKYSLLLATDLAARGLDIIELHTVIQFDLPRTSTEYLHRAGRTGRQGNKGTVINLVTLREEQELKKIAKELKINLQKVRLFQSKLIEDTSQIKGKRHLPLKNN